MRKKNHDVDYISKSISVANYLRRNYSNYSNYIMVFHIIGSLQKMAKMAKFCPRSCWIKEYKKEYKTDS